VDGACAAILILSVHRVSSAFFRFLGLSARTVHEGFGGHPQSHAVVRKRRNELLSELP
jgi:hypothetical protein